MVFISHPEKASSYASRASEIFVSHGYRTWIWDHDRPALGDLDIVLRQEIDQCDYFAHICTGHTRGSKGQEKERLFAKGKPLILLVFKQSFLLMFRRNFVPQDVDRSAIYNEVSHETFDEDCMKAVERLDRERLHHKTDDVAEGQLIAATLRASASMGAASMRAVAQGEEGMPV